VGARVPFKRTDIFHQIATVPGLDPAHHIVANNQETGGDCLHWLRRQIVAPHDGLFGAPRGAGVTAGAGGNGGGPRAGGDGAHEPPLPSFEDLLRLAGSAVAGCEGLLFMPWLNGERSPVEDKIVRAGWLLDAYEKFLKRPVPKVRLLGGGAQSELWCQIYADVLDRPIEQVADPRHAQLRGVALWARVCLGELTLDEVPALVPVATTFTPSPDARDYAAGYAEYRNLYGKLKGLYHRLNSGGAVDGRSR
jgi:xylulokinase